MRLQGDAACPLLGPRSRPRRPRREAWAISRKNVARVRAAKLSEVEVLREASGLSDLIQPDYAYGCALTTTASCGWSAEEWAREAFEGAPCAVRGSIVLGLEVRIRVASRPNESADTRSWVGDRGPNPDPRAPGREFGLAGRAPDNTSTRRDGGASDFDPVQTQAHTRAMGRCRTDTRAGDSVSAFYCRPSLPQSSGRQRPQGVGDVGGSGRAGRTPNASPAGVGPDFVLTARVPRRTR